MTKRLITTVVWLAYVLIPAKLVAADRPPNDEGPRRTESARWIAGGKPVPADGGGPYPYRFIYTDAIGHEPGVTRQRWIESVIETCSRSPFAYRIRGFLPSP